MENKFDITTLTNSELKDSIQKLGEKPFRAKQISEWLWQKGASSFDEMTSLSKNLREKLELNFKIPAIKIAQIQKSSDGTMKLAFELVDGEFVESVLIPDRDASTEAPNRATACISTQVGCKLGCAFCATGKMKFRRNLTSYEIFRQVVSLKSLANDNFSVDLSNIVLMGMGEPLLNYDNTLDAIDIITSPKGFAMSPRRITLSTIGVPNAIRKLADEKVRFNLAVSIHTATNLKRSALMPFNKTAPLENLAEAVEYFHEKTGSRVTFEYLILKNFNDSLKDAETFAKFCRIVPCKVNIIDYNPTENSQFEKTTPARLRSFAELLEGKNMIVNVRRSRGDDIAAACGQLANKKNN